MFAAIGQDRRKSEVVTHVAVEILSKTTLLTRYFLDLTSSFVQREPLRFSSLACQPHQQLKSKICQSIDRRDEMEVNK